MASPDRQEIRFLDDDGNEIVAEELDTGDGTTGRAPRRLVVLERWLPDGGGGALAALVLVLIAWIGAQPLIYAVTALAPQGMHRIGPLTEESINFGGGAYYGVTPGLIPVISYGTRAVVVVIALVLAARARRHEHTALASGAVAVSAVSLVLLVLGGIAMTIGFAHGHSSGFYGTPF